MADLPNRNELFQVGRRSITISADRRRINPATVDVAGSDLNLLIGAGSLMGETIVARLASCLAGLFIDTSFNDKLDRLAFDRFGLTRKSAAPATVDLTFTRPLPGVPTPGVYPAGSLVQTPQGTQFSLDADVVFGNFTTTVSSARATATVAGTSANVASNIITQFSTPPFDPTLTITNPQGAAGGAESENDTEFKGRIRDFFPSVRRGVLSALSFGARTVPGVSVATAIELTNTFGPDIVPAAIVQLIIADANGGASPGLIQRVKDALLDYRALGIPVFVIGGNVLYQNIEWTLAFQPGIDTTQAREDVRSVTVAVAQLLPPGATLFRSSLIAAAKTVPGVIINDASLIEPAGDVIPSNVQDLLRINPAGVSFV